jgi:ribonuclease HI
MITIYTDGSAWPNPGPGGWAAIIDKEEISGSEKQTTNNRMEMTAVLRSLQYVPKNSSVKIHSDSQYVVNGIGCWANGKPTKKGWMVNWRKRGWRLFDGEVKNVDLWKELYELVRLYDSVELVWIRGHNDDPLNERCDELALKARLNNETRT